MNIGTGKDLEEYFYKGKLIPYHLIDILNPNINYSVYNFQKDFIKSYKSILKRDKLPIVCGGTGLYIESLLLNYDFSLSPPPNNELRNQLKNKSIKELKEQLISMNPTIEKNQKMDTKNRIIRNIEIASTPAIKRNKINQLPLRNFTVIGLFPGRTININKIDERLLYRINNGLIEEVESLINNGLNYNRLFYFGLEYRYVSYYLKGEIDKNELISKLSYAIHKFAKKQMTFFRRMEKRGVNINWIAKAQLKCVDKLL